MNSYPICHTHTDGKDKLLEWPDRSCFAALCYRAHPLKHSLAESIFVSRVRKTAKKSSLAEVSLYSVRLWFRMSKVCFQSPNTAIFDLKLCSSQLCVSVCLGHSAISNFHIFAIIRRKRINSVAIHRYFLVLILQLVGLCWNGAYLAATNSAFCVIVLRLTAGYRDLCSLWHKTLILLAPFTPAACFLDT